jgi:hypothetical protein
LGGPLEGEGEERITSEEGIGFAEPDMGGGSSAAKIVVIHTGEVIVDEGVGVQNFEGEAGEEGGIGFAASGFAGSHAEDGAEAFAACENGIAHGFVEDGWACGGSGEVS